VTPLRDDGRPRAWVIAASGLAIGIASGLVAAQVLGGDLPRGGRMVLFLSNLVYWTSWSLLALLVIELAWRLPLAGGRRWRSVAIHAGASLLFPFVHMPLFVLGAVLIRGVVHGGPLHPVDALLDLRWLTRWQVEWEVTMYWALVGLTHASVFRAEAQARALQAARLDAELSQARLQALQQQMHPHFLFNTLQSLSVLMHRDPDAAEDMLSRLGQLLRGSLRTLSAGQGGPSTILIPLARELDYVDHYLRIEGMNIGERLRVELDVAPDTLAWLVPELLIQPLVENAVRHGIAPAVDGGTVRLAARLDRGQLLLQVSDDGVGPGKSAAGSGIALDNTRRRLRLLYGDDHAFEISQPVPGRGLEIRLRLPDAASAAVA
jgi:two-component system, LytTR family, sensor kinase